MGAGKRTGLTLIIVVLLVILGLILFMPSDERMEFPSNYTYEGLNDFVYNFTVDSSRSDVTYHVVAIEFRDGIVKRTANLPFEYSPLELEDIEVPEDIREKLLNSKGIFIVTDPYVSNRIDNQDLVAQATISRITGSKEVNMLPHIFEIDTFGANIREMPGSDRPILDCGNATEVGRIIHLKKSLFTNKIYYDKSNPHCVVLEYSNGDNVVKLATRVVYSLLEIMP